MLPRHLSEEMSVFLSQTEGFIILYVCCGTGGWYAPAEGANCLGITQEESPTRAA